MGLELWTPKLLRADQSLYPLGHESTNGRRRFQALYIHTHTVHVCKSHLGKNNEATR